MSIGARARRRQKRKETGYDLTGLPGTMAGPGAWCRSRSALAFDRVGPVDGETPVGMLVEEGRRPMREISVPVWKIHLGTRITLYSDKPWPLRLRLLCVLLGLPRSIGYEVIQIAEDPR